MHNKLYGKKILENLIFVSHEKYNQVDAKYLDSKSLHDTHHITAYFYHIIHEMIMTMITGMWPSKL